MTESWRTITEFPDYRISNLGQVESRKGKTPKILKQYNVSGYLAVYLRANNKPSINYIHRLVALEFLPNPDNLPQVNHINENKKDNRLENVEWCSIIDNLNYGTRNQRIGASTKGSKKKRCAIMQFSLDGEYIATYKSSNEAERKTGCHHSTILLVCKGVFHKTGGFIWKYCVEAPYEPETPQNQDV